MKVLKYLAVPAMALAMLASCSKKDEPKEQPKQDVLVSVNFGESLRAAMATPADEVAANAAATVKKIDVYLLDGAGIVKEVKSFSEGNEEFTQLTSATAVGQASTTGGYKFLNVDKSVVKVFAVANPQTLVAQGANISTLTAQALKSAVGDAIYYGGSGLTQVGQEGYGVNPQTNSAVVKKAEFELKPAMNRFQVLGLKFQKAVKKADFDAAYATWKAEPEQVGKNEEQLRTAFAAHVGTYDATTGVWSNKTNWEKFFELKDVTDQLTGAIMNRFNKTYTIGGGVADMMYAKTYADGRYSVDNGTFKPNKTDDMSAVASYFATPLALTAKKAIAFNFFVKGITSYDATAPESNGAPRIVFVFKTDGDVTANHRFVAIKGYTGDVKTGDEAGAELINMDLTQYANNNGVLVDADPEIPGVTPGGQDDIESTDFNLIVRVTVKPWTVVNVVPVI